MKFIFTIIKYIIFFLGIILVRAFTSIFIGLLRGGNINNGSNAGPFYLRVDYTISNTNVNFGFRLSLAFRFHFLLFFRDNSCYS